LKRGLSETCYGFFSTLANPTRLAILEKLRERDMSVTELVGALGQEQSMVSHNLQQLARCGLVRSQKEGKSNVYRLNRETMEAIFKVVEDHAENRCPLGGSCPNSR
jgi:ArsR family transcriptional regulator